MHMVLISIIVLKTKELFVLEQYGEHRINLKNFQNKKIGNNKEKIVTSVHFLDQLRNVIHKPKAEIKTNA